MGSLEYLVVDKVPTNVGFVPFSSEEIKKLSVVNVITGLTFDVLGHPLPGGLYDKLMGTHGKRMDTCETCLNIQSCPGHMGHIELNTLVFNPFFIKLVQRILGIFCLNCYKLQMKDSLKEVIILQLRLLDAGFITEAQELDLHKSELVSQNDENMVKLENGHYVHPRVAHMQQLLINVSPMQNTKTSYDIRSAIVHSILQRPASSKCIHCHKALRHIKYLYRKLVYYMNASELKNNASSNKQYIGQNKVIFADECYKYISEIYKNYPEFLKLVVPVLKFYNENDNPVKMFFIDTVPVTPSKARPINVLRDQIVEHPQTTVYRNIIQNNSVLRIIIQYIKKENKSLTEEALAVYESTKGGTAHEKFYNAWQSLQTSIDILLDVNASPKDALTLQGLKQVLEKKDGLIRKHMMGKRVNYAARTVITPDPNINVEDIGIPDLFAKKLSYPVPVTAWNVTELRKMVLNGPNIYPGANYIQDERGFTTLIPTDNRTKRESMAKLLFSYPENGLKIVHRHILNGDPLLLNRQPSLHKPSIMAHKARILTGEKTFRLHYSNCKAYNADFDGDEMNAHYPQCEIARSEAYNLVNVTQNYLVPKDGTPLGGLIQDHVIAGVKLSMRGRFFNKQDYQQLVFQGLSIVKSDIQLLPPSILKPIKLWSGKQVLSTVIMNIIPKGYKGINLHSNAKIGSKHWNTQASRLPMTGCLIQDCEMSESEVVIHNNELLVGVLDKQQYGATTFGLIHCMHELYGGSVSTSLLTAFTKLFTVFLQREGFTLGVKDILVNQSADTKRLGIISKCREIGKSVITNLLDIDHEPEHNELAEKIDEAYFRNNKFRIILDRKYKSTLDEYTNNINNVCLPEGLQTKFPHNNLQLMVLSGAKGSLVNTMQISSLLGQIELEGKRPPLMISNKSLPSFTNFETSPKSGGFIDGRFMTGIQPQDFFFHCMAGREGLIDTAVKTSRSGYLQRCLIKHLEGLTVNYDLTVRDSDNCVIQYLYGEDGLDVLKSKFFDKKIGINFLMDNSNIILHQKEMYSIKNCKTYAKVTQHAKNIQSWHKKQKTIGLNVNKLHKSPFTNFSAELRNQIEIAKPNEINKKSGRRQLDESILKLWKKANTESKMLYRKSYSHCPDPTCSVFKQDVHFGAVSEAVEHLIDAYVQQHPSRSELVADLMYIKNMKALAEPGEPVGLLAAQSIGEPSTQMTLNTFHFAGRGEMNVTLGIPRLREILMLASSNIKTPSMDIPIKAGQRKNAEKLRIKLNRTTLADILHYVHIKVNVLTSPERIYQYKIKFQFLPREVYHGAFCVRPKRVLKFMNDTFIKKLLRVIIKSSKNKTFTVNIDEKEGNQKEKNKYNSYDFNDNLSADEGSSNRNETRKSYENANDSDISDNDDLNHEDNATDIKLKSQKQDEADYEDPDNDDEIEDANEEEEVASLYSLNMTFNNLNEDDAFCGNLLNNEIITDYSYDQEQHLWCKLTFKLNILYKKPDISSIIRDLATKCIVHQIQDINRAIIYSNNNVQLLKTDGVNVVEMFAHNKVLDLNRLYTNDIHTIAKTYGIEAAARVIINEVTNVFKVYGITIDRRHLSLIADYMTFDGTFQPLSRKGMDNSSSPLQQMSFESCLQFLKNAASFGRNDNLNSPSSRLMVGLPVKNGTGAFELFSKMI